MSLMLLYTLDSFSVAEAIANEGKESSELTFSTDAENETDLDFSSQTSNKRSKRVSKYVNSLLFFISEDRTF